MGDVPQQVHHETHVTVTAVPLFRPQLHVEYFKSIPFILRVICLILAIIVMICIGQSPWQPGSDGFIWFTAIIAILISIGFTVIYIIGVVQGMPVIPWALIELGVQAVWALFYFISGILAIVNARKAKDNSKHVVVPGIIYHNEGYWNKAHDCHAAAVFFCWVAAIVHGIIAFLCFRIWWANRSLPMQQQQQQPGHTVNVPTTYTT